MGRKPKTRRDAYGAWLFHLRKEKGLTQQEMSRLLGVPRTTLAFWERSGNLTGRKIILKMSSVFDLSPNKLLRPNRDQPKRK